jgi:hypothetical protein
MNLIVTKNGQRKERVLGSEQERIVVLRDLFGIIL